VSARAVRAACAAVLVTAFAAGTVSAQEHVPQPFSPDEFQQWMKDSWRAEAVFFGSFPFSLFVTLEVYDSIRYVSNKFNPSFAPWPLGSGTAVSYSAQETLWLAVSAVSISMLISGIDYLIGRMNEPSPGH
jgi:hypothetical protein